MKVTFTFISFAISLVFYAQPNLQDGDVSLAFKERLTKNSVNSINIFNIQKVLSGRMRCISITALKKDETITIKDIIDNNPIPQATLSFVFPEKKDTLRYIANDSGVVSSNSLPKLEGCEMIVTAVGYKPDSKIFKFLNKAGALEIYLTRDIKTCDEVIIAPTVCYRRIGCGWGSKIIRHPEMKELPDNQPPKALAIFPNPVRKGSIINFSTYDNGKEHLIIKIFTGNGRLTTSQRITINNGFASLPTDPRLSSGTYFLQAFYENGRLAASGKLIVQ